MDLARLDRQVDTFQNRLVFVFKIDVQVLDLKHFYSFQLICAERRGAMSDHPFSVPATNQ